MKFYSILEGNTQDVLRRFLRLINKSIARIGTVEASVDDLEDDVGTLKTTVGGTNSGLVKSVADINTAIGDATTPAEGTILARIQALEDAAAAAEETQGEG